MNDHPIIGFYCPNDDIFPVYQDPVSGEVYYLDEQDNAYLLTGFDLISGTTANLNTEELPAMLDDLSEDCIGCILDGDTKILLTVDNAYHRVPADATTVRDATETGTYEDDMEYEIPEDGEDE